jgi:hypothetical protein
MIYQILLRKPLSWLIDMNALALLTALYAAGFVNFPYVVAEYNVENSREIAGAGPSFDADYAASLGPEALPAIDEYLRRRPADMDAAAVQRLLCWRKYLSVALPSVEWRGWSFRAWRLRKYLASDGAAARAAESESVQLNGCRPWSYD